MKLKLAAKLVGGFVALAVLAAAIGVTGTLSLQIVNGRNHDSYDHNILAVTYAEKMESAFLRIRIDLYRALAVPDESVAKNIGNDLIPLKSEWNENESLYAATIDEDLDRQNYEKYATAKKTYLAMLEELVPAIAAGQKNEAFAIIAAKGFRAGQDLMTVIREIIDHHVKTSKDIEIQNWNDGTTAQIAMIALTVLGIAAALFLGFRIARSISRAIGGEPEEIAGIVDSIALGRLDVQWSSLKKKATGIRKSMEQMTKSLKEKAQQIEKLASGDLTVEIKAVSEEDSLARSLQTLATSLSDTIRDIQNMMEQTLEGAEQVSGASQQLSQASTLQASSLEEIAATITEISSQTQKNAENAQEANQLAQKALETSNNGNSRMRELVEAMKLINSSSEDIKKVIKVIDDIAFQINLLALNANVEAARAGRYGRGFAVVADEVRNLAVKSSQSVKETTEMVESSIRNILRGSELVQKTAQQLETIANDSTKVAEIVSEISAASREQAIGLGQIESALSLIDQSTQTNTASAEETASAAEELNGQAQTVQDLLRQFRIEGESVQTVLIERKELTSF